jgi:trehalose 6-phosphate synthase/phosphatase
VRLIIVSNRAPVNIVENEEGYHFHESSGGLASGLRAYVEQMRAKDSDLEILWIGWPGAAVTDEAHVSERILAEHAVKCVFLSPELMENFYEGFCNKTIWPLFHYFPVYTQYERSFWEDYQKVNNIYCEAVMEVANEDDIIWVHDYHLMLLPAMLRERMPSASIGFFLHIPFPSYEIFRMLPSEWRIAIMEGVCGADLIGFHTFDYCTYFLRSALRILGITDHMGEVIYKDRTLKVDTFPMGIDFDKYHKATFSQSVSEEILKLENYTSGRKIILSIDRQDYSKGILNRLKGYEVFLDTNPDWREKVSMIMIVIPSRIGVESYQSIKSSIDELSGHINSKHGTINWMPIIYRYSSVSFDELIALYNYSDVALITPLRDGMNLIAKEYIACRTSGRGVLIMSEMAGAASELIESIIINPNNKEEIGDALLAALEMPVSEQQQRARAMQERIKKYSVFEWANDFLTTLKAVKAKQHRLSARIPNSETIQYILNQFNTSSRRFLFLDYDGTLIPFAETPDKAIPGDAIISLLNDLAALPDTEVVLISGRGRFFLENWFGHLPLNIVAEHGHFIRHRGHDWELIKPIRNRWKSKIIDILDQYTSRLPGAFVEEKEYSVVFHYRRSEPARAAMLVKQLMNHLISYTSNLDIQVAMLKGNKVLEVYNAGVDKGLAALKFLPENTEDVFILAAGDDHTDENLFRAMPENAFTLKVRYAPSYARFNVSNPEDLIAILKNIAKLKEAVRSDS